MTGKEALEIVKWGGVGYSYETYLEAQKLLIKDLEILEFIKTHYEMNGFNELIPKYDDDIKKFNELEEWLKK
jgi:hypothetical protein